MPDLVASGEQPAQHWRRLLPPGQPVILGRAADVWAVPWDRWISRQHAELVWEEGRLYVRLLPGARNPLFFRGKDASSASLGMGESFVIGTTTFTLDAGKTLVRETRPLVQERSISARELQTIPFRDAPRRLDVLCRLPDVIASAPDDLELFAQLVNLLLAGIPRADAIALVALEPAEAGAPAVRVLHAETRLVQTARFEPSRHLVGEAVGRQQQTVLHVWGDPGGAAAETGFTQQSDIDWAFCVPVRGEGGRGWGIYVAGRCENEQASTLLVPWSRNELGDDLKFAELAAAILSSLRQARKLQSDRVIMNRFFSPAVQRLLASAEPEQALRPLETQVTVLFCDLRGFSRQVEAAAADLLGVLERVSGALGVMTRWILDQRGAVADFLGDSVLGFWGWPLAEPDMTRWACQAALGIRAQLDELARIPNHPLSGFRIGMGLATGRAVAGRIGPLEQAKVSVFGPAVNLAARLEGMTRMLNVTILIDEATARVVREQMSPRDVRCRRLALVQPYGLETPLMVSELLAPQDQDPSLSDEHLAHYEAALDAFLRGDWGPAIERLHLIPPSDLGADLLTGFIIGHKRTPPPDWNGVIPLTSKNG